MKKAPATGRVYPVGRAPKIALPIRTTVAPSSTRTEITRLAIDREVHPALDDHPQLFGGVTMLRDDRVRRQLHDRQRDPLALDPPGTNGLAPDREEREVGEILEVAHRASAGAATLPQLEASRRNAECAACQPHMP